jgi:predicted dehydrogenase
MMPLGNHPVTSARMGEGRDMAGIGIVGLGMAAKPHMLAIRDLEASGRARLVGGFAPSAARRDAFAAAWGAPVFDRLDALLAAPGLDLVIVLTPPGAHLPVAEAAAKAGRHVLVEKPLEITLARAEELVAMADRAGVTLGVVFQHRFRPGALRLKQAAAAMSSVSMDRSGEVRAKPATCETGPARCSSRSSVWIAWVSSTPPPSRARIPRPGCA